MFLSSTQNHLWHRSTELDKVEQGIVEDVFVQLMTYVDRVEQLYPYEEQLRAARAATGEHKTHLYVRAYHELEAFITSSRPPVVAENITQKLLRKELLQEIFIERLPKPFQIIQMEESEQLIVTYIMANQNLYTFLEVYASKRVATDVLIASFERAMLVDSEEMGDMNFDTFVAHLEHKEDEDVFQACRLLYWELSAAIRHAFGDMTAIALSRRDYDFFTSTYGEQLGKRFLDILPEGVLEMERLASMSREELERKIKERTGELKNFNEQLEKRVSERTTELEEANKRLRELDKVKTEFISVAAHQLRTPLAAIKWTLSTIIETDEDNLTTEQKTLLLKGYESTERIIRLVNQMLVVTRIESGRIQYEFTPIHIENVIDAVLLDFVAVSEEKKVEVVFHKPETQLPYVQADPDKIRSVLQNLIENSMQYTHENGLIELSAEQEGEMIKVSVKDNGIGIPKKQQSGIFNKFFRAENASKERTDGSGLGLFVMKNIVENHGGAVGFESEEDVGTTFFFTIPIATEQAAPKAQEQRQTDDGDE